MITEVFVGGPSQPKKLLEGDLEGGGLELQDGCRTRSTVLCVIYNLVSAK